MSEPRAQGGLRLTGAGFLWAVVYLLVWGVAWFAFMRTAWFDALGAGRPMPWAEIWIVWVVLCLPLGWSIAAYLRSSNRKGSRARTLVRVVLVLWVPMTLGMFGWAWFDSISLVLITIDSAVNLIALAGATRAADAVHLHEIHPPR